tara:strand:+ start:11936 stop:12955 length:1020 start_codon:yes stop_codon:yes gene_type:complete
MIENILVVGPAWVGDMVMSQTLYKTLKQEYPHANIDVIAPKSSRVVLDFMPEVRNAIALDIAHGEFAWRKRRQLGKQLLGQYDWAICTVNSWKSALVPFFAKVARRTSWLGEQRYLLLNDHRKLVGEEYPLMIDRFAALAYPAGTPVPKQQPWPKLVVEAEAVDATLKSLGLHKTERPILALCPGAEFGPAKRWPAEYYAEVAKQKIADGWDVWLFGSPKEADAADIIQQQTDNACTNIVGKTNLSQAIQLMSIASAAVCNDSGLMHVAGALSIPLVVVYGSTTPKFTPPLSLKLASLTLELPCSPCFKRECPLQHMNCLNQLMPVQVIDALASFQDEE